MSSPTTNVQGVPSRVDALQSGRPAITLEIVSNPLYLSGAREMVSSVARRLGFAEEACGQMSLAVDEALCNIIRHGYERRDDRPIWIRLFPLAEPGTNGVSPSSQPTALKIVIEDEAKQVDPSTIKSRDLEEIRPGGLGVHIIKAVMDEVRYERREASGMRLTMVKTRQSRATPVAVGGECCGGTRGATSGACATAGSCCAESRTEGGSQHA
jgi:serine/threonine-protein kinase RsbW